MLVLSRKPNQKIRIGENITITVVRVNGNTIRLGIDAPKEVRVIRSELEPDGTKKPGCDSSSQKRAEEKSEDLKPIETSHRHIAQLPRPEEFSRREDDVKRHAPLALYTCLHREPKFAIGG